MDFDLQLNQWADKVKGNLDEFKRAFALEMVTVIQSYTPVETGRLRASIQASFDGADIMISTNVEYARRIEYGFVGEDQLGRHYDQKGVFMFTRAIAEADEIAERVIERLSK